MIRSRLATPEDITAVTKLLGEGMFSPARDFCCVSTLEGCISGVVLARPVMLCHGLAVLPGPTARHQASQLIHYGKGIIMGNEKLPKEMVMICDPENVKVQAYFEDQGAVKDKPGVIYFMGVD